MKEPLDYVLIVTFICLSLCLLSLLVLGMTGVIPLS